MAIGAFFEEGRHGFSAQDFKAGIEHGLSITTERVKLASLRNRLNDSKDSPLVEGYDPTKHLAELKNQPKACGVTDDFSRDRPSTSQEREGFD